MTNHTGTNVPLDLQALKILQGFSFFPFPYILIIKPFLLAFVFFFFLCLKLPIEKFLNKKVSFTDLFTYSISAF